VVHFCWCRQVQLPLWFTSAGAARYSCRCGSLLPVPPGTVAVVGHFCRCRQVQLPLWVTFAGAARYSCRCGSLLQVPPGTVAVVVQ
jgi:hypothetical protein